MTSPAPLNNSISRSIQAAAETACLFDQEQGLKSLKEKGARLFQLIIQDPQLDPTNVVGVSPLDCFQQQRNWIDTHYALFEKEFAIQLQNRFSFLMDQIFANPTPQSDEAIAQLGCKMADFLDAKKSQVATARHGLDCQILLNTALIRFMAECKPFKALYRYISNTPVETFSYSIFLERLDELKLFVYTIDLYDYLDFFKENISPIDHQKISSVFVLSIKNKLTASNKFPEKEAKKLEKELEAFSSKLRKYFRRKILVHKLPAGPELPPTHPQAYSVPQPEFRAPLQMIAPSMILGTAKK